MELDAGPGATRQGSGSGVRTQLGGRDVKTVTCIFPECVNEWVNERKRKLVSLEYMCRGGFASSGPQNSPCVCE